MEKAQWGRSIVGELYKRWPKDEGGEPVEPLFLCRKKCVDMEDELTVNMLEAYGIPCLRVYPGDGGFGRVVLGMSGNGADIYVPSTMYEDSKKLCEEESEENDQL